MLIHYLAVTERGTVERVEEGGRVVIVISESGAMLEFHLMASTHFVTRDRSARLGWE